TWLGQVESAWRPKAVSWAAASGLWQFVPGTGRQFGLKQTAWVDERNSYEQATRASAKYLKSLATRYNGNWELAMAAYNTGAGKGKQFFALLKRIPAERRDSARVISVAPGEDLQAVASRTGVSVSQLQAMNTGVDLKATTKLVVPNSGIRLTSWRRAKPGTAE